MSDPLRTWCHSPTVVYWCGCTRCSEATRALTEAAEILRAESKPWWDEPRDGDGLALVAVARNEEAPGRREGEPGAEEG